MIVAKEAVWKNVEGSKRMITIQLPPANIPMQHAPVFTIHNMYLVETMIMDILAGCSTKQVNKL